MTITFYKKTLSETIFAAPQLSKYFYDQQLSIKAY